MLDQLFTIVLVQPVYNFLMFLYAAVGHNAGLTLIVVGIIVASFFIPTMIAGYHDLLRTRLLKDQIRQIQLEVQDPTEQQERILKLLRKKQISFRSASIFMIGIAAAMGLAYPSLMHYWSIYHPELIYDFWAGPGSFDPDWLGFDLSQSSATLSLLPVVLLFFELRQSYSEQKFLTSFIDRWYPVILPLFVYFLIFWLPSGLSLLMAAAVGTSLYIRLLLFIFASIRQGQRTGQRPVTRS